MPDIEVARNDAEGADPWSCSDLADLATARAEADALRGERDRFERLYYGAITCLASKTEDLYQAEKRIGVLLGERDQAREQLAAGAETVKLAERVLSILRNRMLGLPDGEWKVQLTVVETAVIRRALAAAASAGPATSSEGAL